MSCAITRLGRVIALGVVVQLLACAHAACDQEPPAALESVWRDYLELPGQKAIAIAGSPRRTHWVVGVVSGFQKDADADSAALAECAKRRVASRVQPQCVLFARNEKIVWRGY